MNLEPLDVLQINAYQSEYGWWKEFMGGPGAATLTRQADPNLEVQDYIAKYIKSSDDVILDVGAGPLTQVGYKWKGKPIKVVAVDPLAEAYNSIPLPVERPVTTQFGFGESLSDLFPKNTFDITHARNSLDHSIDPLKCIYEMIEVTKPGGHIILHHCQGEGNRTNYEGLHQWDFLTKDGFFYISGAKQDTLVNVTRHLGYLAVQVDLSTPLIHSPWLQRDVAWVDMVLQKRA